MDLLPQLCHTVPEQERGSKCRWEEWGGDIKEFVPSGEEIKEFVPSVCPLQGMRFTCL